MSLPILNYRTPPQVLVHRAPWQIVAARWFAGLSILFYVVLLVWEPGFQEVLQSKDSDRWFDNEAERRILERDRRAGIVTPIPPPIPVPIAPGKILSATLIGSRVITLLWALVFAVLLASVGEQLSKARDVIHGTCIVKIAIVGPIMILSIVAYAKPFIEAGARTPLFVALGEIAFLGWAWHLLMKLPLPE